MTALIKMTKQAITDRKGVTALEYALIAGAVATLMIAGFNGLFTTIQTYLTGISLG